MKYAAAFLAAALIATPAIAAPSGDTQMTTVDHVHDFDFLVGKWKVHHWRLNGRLVGSHDWVEFEGTSQFWTTMNGLGNVDDNYVGLPGDPYRAMSVRAYDPVKQVWSIWWIDGRHPGAPLDPPVVGNIDWKDGAGHFDGDTVNNGKTVLCRYTWSKITKNSAHWEQAFSPDGGKTWEVNWRMDFTRVQ
jgi:hypothetical protein